MQLEHACLVTSGCMPCRLETCTLYRGDGSLLRSTGFSHHLDHYILFHRTDRKPWDSMLTLCRFCQSWLCRTGRSLCRLTGRFRHHIAPATTLVLVTATTTTMRAVPVGLVGFSLVGLAAEETWPPRCTQRLWSLYKSWQLFELILRSTYSSRQAFRRSRYRRTCCRRGGRSRRQARSGNN